MWCCKTQIQRRIPHIWLLDLVSGEITWGSWSRSGSLWSAGMWPPACLFHPQTTLAPTCALLRLHVPGWGYLSGNWGCEWKMPTPASSLCADPHKGTWEEALQGASVQPASKSVYTTAHYTGLGASHEKCKLWQSFRNLSQEVWGPSSGGKGRLMANVSHI